MDYGVDPGNRVTIGTPRDVKRLVSPVMLTGSTDPANTAWMGYSSALSGNANAVVVPIEGWNTFLIEPVGVGSDGGTYSLKIFYRESNADTAPSGRDGVVGYTRNFIADFTVALGGGTRSTVFNGPSIGTGVTIRCAETLTQETVSPYPITSGGIRYTSPGNDLQGFIEVVSPGADLELLFVADGSNVTSMNAFVRRY